MQDNKAQAAVLAERVAAQIDEGERKGFDFKRDSFFTKVLYARLAAVVRLDEFQARPLTERIAKLAAADEGYHV